LNGPAPARMLVAAVVALLALAPVAAGATARPNREGGTGSDALRKGNRLFRQGDPAAAVDAYLEAGTAAAENDPVLAYNLATALHWTGRLPEAIVWYRRAERGFADDPWLVQNLERAREALAAPRPGPPRALAPLLLHPWMLPALATLTTWLALALVSLRGRHPDRRRRVIALLATAAVLWAGQIALERLGPRPAVLLQPCGTSLPAGSEVWVSPGKNPSSGTWTVHTTDRSVQCPSMAVALL